MDFQTTEQFALAIRREIIRMLAEAKLQVPILTMQETVSFLTCQNQEKEGK